MSTSTVILFFTRPDNGKQLGATKKAHRGVWQVLHHHTRDMLANTQLPVVEWGPSLQQGQTFIERLDHAIGTLQQEGWQYVIIIGDDCPQLSSKVIQEASMALQQGQHVVGPDQDGGAYLIGLSLAHWPQEGFKNLPWQTYRLADALVALLSASLPLHLLSTRQDVNTYLKWFALWRAGMLDKKLVQLLGAYLMVFLRPQASINGISLQCYSSTTGRSPPVPV